jgi:3-phosphoshikimate 1-carboxyvinyltransferase
LDLLDHAGCVVEWGEGGVLLDASGKKGRLKSPGTLDLNETPDLLPAAAVLACFCEGETRLVNVAHARIKETDRVACMARELRALGAAVSELPDGLVIRGGAPLHGGTVSSSDDHRIAMALGCAALGAEASVTVRGAECADVTYRGFWEMLG